MTDPVLNMLGLCARARKLVTGEKAVVQAIRAGGCFADRKSTRLNSSHAT